MCPTAYCQLWQQLLMLRKLPNAWIGGTRASRRPSSGCCRCCQCHPCGSSFHEWLLPFGLFVCAATTAVDTSKACCRKGHLHIVGCSPVQCLLHRWHSTACPGTHTSSRSGTGNEISDGNSHSVDVGGSEGTTPFKGKLPVRLLCQGSVKVRLALGCVGHTLPA